MMKKDSKSIILAFIFGMPTTLLTGFICKSPPPSYADGIPIPLTNYPVCGFPLSYCTVGFSRVVVGSFLVDLCFWAVIIYMVVHVVQVIEKRKKEERDEDEKSENV